MPSTFRIHPAFGVARVGDSDGPGFIGPEMPRVPANWNFDAVAFDKFKDDRGHIKRQGVRFRVYEYDDGGNVVGECLSGRSGVSNIEWTVYVANRKASFFRFDGALGEDGDFSQNGARNEAIKGAARRELEIDPGAVTISGISAAPVVLTNPNPATSAAIPDLGEIATDPDGRLMFFGGHGKTFQQRGAHDIDNYVNNDGWFDDVSDGPVRATVVFQDGRRVEAISAWVSVGPPDFAPSIANVVSLYDTMWDVAVREKGIPIPDISFFRASGTLERLTKQRDDWDSSVNRFRTYKPSFEVEIADILKRAFDATFVHYPPDIMGRPFHITIDPSMWQDLGDPDPKFDNLRKDIFARMRNPMATSGADSNKMPRGLGDQYCDENETPVGDRKRDNSKRFFSLTLVQFAILDQWAKRNFEPGSGPLPIPSTPPAISPDGLDRAVLENCVGGPFFPGIEVSWSVRNSGIYEEPFRVKVGVRLAGGDAALGIGDVVTQAGFFTQQMALPWQADFRDCKRERLDRIPLAPDGKQQDTWAMWWAGQRPDDVFSEDDVTRQVRWARTPHFVAGDDDDERYKEMVQHWFTLGFVARKIGEKWVETERTP